MSDSNVKLTLIQESTDWKDRAVGWHKYRAVWTCDHCGDRHTEVIFGQLGKLKEYYETDPDCLRDEEGIEEVACRA